jgi:hypothetical protein
MPKKEIYIHKESTLNYQTFLKDFKETKFIEDYITNVRYGRGYTLISTFFKGDQGQFCNTLMIAHEEKGKLEELINEIKEKEIHFDNSYK